VVQWVNEFLDLYTPAALSKGGVKASWGFKAPISMLTIPVFAHALAQRGQGLRVLHVLRDGRDLSFSGNQSPVQKLWHPLHPTTSAKQFGAEAAALQLWDENNVGAWSFARRNAAKPGPVEVALSATEAIQVPPELAAASRMPSLKEAFLGYLLVRYATCSVSSCGRLHPRRSRLGGAHRIEDFVFKDRKAALVQRVAAFVGAPTDKESVCRVVRLPATDLGSHGKVNRRAGLAARFGKWKEKIGKISSEIARQAMSKSVRDSRALKMFGYDPEVDSLWIGESLFGADAC